MGRTCTDFLQLSKGMFRKSDPVVEVKPVPKETSAGGGAGSGRAVWAREKGEEWHLPTNALDRFFMVGVEMAD